MTGLIALNTLPTKTRGKVTVSCLLTTISFNSDMNWDHQLNSILSVADGSVAKMRERLTSPGKCTRGGKHLFPAREKVHESDLDPPALPPRAPLLRQPSPSPSPCVQWADLAAIQSQLQIQSQVVESLTKKIHDMERERQSQQCHIQTLQEQVHRLREREGEREELRRGPSPGEERKMEQWKREVGRELSSLRGHITRATSLGNLEESFTSKLHREELEHLRREVDQLKSRLRRQEEDGFLQQAEARETRRRCQHNCKTLEELTDGYRTNSTDLTKTVSQCLHTQEEVHQIRTVVSELKEEIKRLILRAHEPTTLMSSHASGASPLPCSHSRGARAEDSDSEDFSPTPSLAEVSSDDQSWLDDKEPVLHQKPPIRLSIQSRRSDFAGPGSDQEDDDSDNYLKLDLGSDLSLGDL